ncbi:MAG: PIN domain nuclease [Kiritimatiellae bacterium]|jgi:predicted nucleic acid-binding protein|nr:PIN domain nuclease [Kiritimatiellia bacterium]
MMIFVDTSVWIEFFAGRDGPEVSTLMRALDEGHTLLYTGLVLQELFQGIESKPSRVRVEAHFNPFVEVFPTRETHFLAADLYRAARKQGFQIRSSIDCLFAACCLQQGGRILARDRDFAFLSHFSKVIAASICSALSY